jgi:hypothetical protein
MECYQCLQSGISREAIGLCHHCSAALCSEHICAVEEPLMIKHLMVPATVFPKKARLMLSPSNARSPDTVVSQTAHLRIINVLGLAYSFAEVSQSRLRSVKSRGSAATKSIFDGVKCDLENARYAS